MADKTHIEWTDATWNIITGCSVVSPGCKDCYAMGLAGSRLKNHPSRVGLTMDTKAGPVWTGEVRFNEAWLDQPLRWTKPRRIFPCAHGDLFHENVPYAWIDRVFAVMALAPQHTFQVLTKRADRMRAYFERLRAEARDRGERTDVVPQRIDDAAADLTATHGGALEEVAWPLANVWLGVSAEDQVRADERLPNLLETPAAVRWVSLEPMIGPVDLTRIPHDEPIDGVQYYIDTLTGRIWAPEGASPYRGHVAGGRKYVSLCGWLNWVVVGGESGGERPMHPEWARQVRHACQTSKTAFLFKQWGSWVPVPSVEGPHGPLCAMTASGRRVPVGAIPTEHNEDGWTAWIFEKVGKKAAGRLLDGVEHNGMPGMPSS